METSRLRDEDIDAPEVTQAELDRMTDALHDGILQALTQMPKVQDWDADQSQNPLLQEAIRKACATYTGWEDLARLTFDFTYDAAERKTVVHVNGPVEVMERIMRGGFQTDPDFASKVDVSVTLEKGGTE